MDRETVRQIRKIIEARCDELRDEWDAMEKGTVESRGVLDRLEELLDMKWRIIDAADAAEDELQQADPWS